MTHRSPRAKRPPECKMCGDTGKVLETRTYKHLHIVDRRVVPCPKCQPIMLDWVEVTPKPN